jgi:hypothetical protein
MTGYALRRGRDWITAPEGDCRPGQPIPPVLAISDDSSLAWLSSTIEQALERASLLRMCWGWATEIRRIDR